MSKLYKSMEIKGATGKVHDDGRKIYRAVATTAALDRYGDVVLPGGADLKNFMKNPVLLGIHNYEEVTIGHILAAEQTDEGIDMEFVFSKDEYGQKYESRYESGDMRAFSIGFKPKKNGVVQLWSWWDDEPEIKSVDIEMPDGTEKTVTFEGMDQVPYRIFRDWEMLELSAVPVPANPEALMKEAAEGIIRKAMEQSPAMRSFAQEKVRDIMEPLLLMLREAEELPESDVVDGSVEAHYCDRVTEDSLSAADVKAKLAKWASKDGSGEKDQMNWAKFSHGFASFDAEKLDGFGSYKYLHHDVDETGLILSWLDLKKSMTEVLASIDGEDIGDTEKRAYAHLASHFADLDKDIPELRPHSEEELKALEALSLAAPEVKEPTQPAGSETPDGDDSSDVKKTIESATDDGSGVEKALVERFTDLTKMIEKRFEEIEESLITLNIKATAVHDLLELRKEKAVKKAVADGNGNAVAAFEVSANLFETLERLAE